MEREEFTDEELIASGLNPHPTCWSDSGITVAERAAMQYAARLYPDGAYAAFIKAMDEGETLRRNA